jgi:capsular polysaccharide biosynthesis protein
VTEDFPVERETPRWRAGTRSHRWVYAVAVAVGIVAAVAAFLAVRLQAAKYESTSAIAVDQVRAIAVSGDAGVVAKLSALRNKYAGILTSEEFAAPVATTVHLAPGTVRASLFAVVPGDGLIFEVGARTSSATTSREIAAAAATALVNYAQEEQTAAGIQPDQQFTLRVVTPAEGAAKISPTRKKEAGAAGLAGLLAAAVVLAVAAIRSRDDD